MIDKRTPDARPGETTTGISTGGEQGHDHSLRATTTTAGSEQVSTRSRDEIDRDIRSLRERTGTHTSTTPAEVRARARTGDDRVTAAPSDERLRYERVQRVDDDPLAGHTRDRDYKDDSDKSSAKLEREVESERAEITDILDQLRDKMSPGQLFDQALDYARNSGGGEFSRNLGRSVRDNPLPVLMVGAGIAWLMASGGRRQVYRDDIGDNRGDNRYRETSGGPSMTERASSAASKVGDTARDMGSRIAGAARSASDAVTGAVSSGSKAASDTTQAMSDRAASSYGNGRDRAGELGDKANRMSHDARDRVGEFAHEARERGGEYADWASSAAQDARDRAYRTVDSARHSWHRMAEEQPVVLGAIGLALGAAIGALLPSTRTENRYMGGASDALKSQVEGAAQREYEHAKDVLGEAYEDVKEDLDKRGFNPETAAGAASAAAKKAGDAAIRVAEDVKSDTKREVDKATDSGKSDESSKTDSTSFSAPSSGSTTDSAKPLGGAGSEAGSGLDRGMGVSGYGAPNPGSNPVTGPSARPTTGSTG